MLLGQLVSRPHVWGKRSCGRGRDVGDLVNSFFFLFLSLLSAFILEIITMYE